MRRSAFYGKLQVKVRNNQSSTMMSNFCCLPKDLAQAA